MRLGLDFHLKQPAAAAADLDVQVKGTSPHAAEIAASAECFFAKC